MKIRSTRSFNAIPATKIRGVFNMYISNLLCKMYRKYFIYFSLTFFLFLTSVKFLVANSYLPTYLPPIFLLQGPLSFDVFLFLYLNLNADNTSCNQGPVYMRKNTSPVSPGAERRGGVKSLFREIRMN